MGLLVACCPLLQELDLRDCDSLTDASLETLRILGSVGPHDWVLMENSSSEPVHASRGILGSVGPHDWIVMENSSGEPVHASSLKCTFSGSCLHTDNGSSAGDTAVDNANDAGHTQAQAGSFGTGSRPASGRRLKELDIGYCYRISWAAILAFQTWCPGVHLHYTEELYCYAAESIQA